jgi:hypothetical protein
MKTMDGRAQKTTFIRASGAGLADLLVVSNSEWFRLRASRK